LIITAFTKMIYASEDCEVLLTVQTKVTDMLTFTAISASNLNISIKVITAIMIRAKE